MRDLPFLYAHENTHLLKEPRTFSLSLCERLQAKCDVKMSLMLPHIYMLQRMFLRGGAKPLADPHIYHTRPQTYNKHVGFTLSIAYTSSLCFNGGASSWLTPLSHISPRICYIILLHFYSHAYLYMHISHVTCLHMLHFLI